MVQTAGKLPCSQLISARFPQHTSSATPCEGMSVYPAVGDSLFLALLASFLSYLILFLTLD